MKAAYSIGMMRAAAWWDGTLRTDLSVAQVAEALRSPDAQVWIDLTDPTAEALGELTETLYLHPLVVEDIVERNQRAKVEVSEHYAHLVMFAFRLDGELTESEIDFVLGDRFLLTSHLAEWDPDRSHELRGGLGPILSRGADLLLWALVDDLVDSYFPLFDQIDEEIDRLEDLIVARPNSGTIERIFDLKRQLMTIRRATSPQREIFNQLTNRELPFVKAPHILYFRDVYDHLIRLTDELDSFRDRLTGALDAYLSAVNNNLSEIMKRLTAVTVVVAGVGALAGIFGMSEAGAAFLGAEAPGFWLVTVAIVGVSAAAAFFLRRIRWL